MKKQRPSTARTNPHNSSRVGSVRHVQKRASLHRQIKAARALHHKIVLHPLSIITLLAAGVLIVGWTLGVAADSYNVTAKVAAAPLKEGAVITEPADGFLTQSSPITVAGSCPDSSYIKLVRDGAFSGVAVCSGNTFSIQTSLASGVNIILAQDYNITDDPGPATPGITVTYNPPATPQNNPATAPSSGGSTSSALPLLVMSDYHYQAFTVGSIFSWTLRIDGGVAPYHLHTDWGDKQSSEQVVLGAQNVTIEHTYARPGYYPIVVDLTDIKNTATVLQLAALIKQPEAAGAFGSTPNNGSATPLSSVISRLIDSKSWLWLAWPAYAIIVLMAVSFWLGERQELQKLMVGQRLRTHRPHHR